MPYGKSCLGIIEVCGQKNLAATAKSVKNVPKFVLLETKLHGNFFFGIGQTIVAMFGSYQMLINGIDFDIKQRKWYAEENDNKNPKQMRIIQSDSEFYNKYEPSNMLSE